MDPFQMLLILLLTQGLKVVDRYTHFVERLFGRKLEGGVTVIAALLIALFLTLFDRVLIYWIPAPLVEFLEEFVSTFGNLILALGLYDLLKHELVPVVGAARKEEVIIMNAPPPAPSSTGGAHPPGRSAYP